MDYIKTYFFEDLLKINIISEYLASKEDYIIKTYPFISDFGTGLDINNVITRSGGYNVFKLEDEPVELKEYLSFISKCYYDYIDNILPNKTFVTSEINPGINCWLNVIRENESIGMHKHSEDNGNFWSFVSATSVLNATGTSTNYKHNDKVFSIPNEIGSLTLFPPFYNHWTDINESKEKRVTLGMDILFNYNNCDSCGAYQSNLIPLINGSN